MALTDGTRLGPYEIHSALGAGGMGEVYRARDTRLDREVAVKVLPSDVASDPERRARFEREAKAVAALDHPHICGIYDVGQADGTHYLVMPLLEGQTLAARLERGPLPIGDALKVAREIADALDRAHRHGIVHRDLKPANVMLTKTGVKLLDFGLAKLRSSASVVSLSSGTQTVTTTAGTAQGTILGTIHYMAPEQVEGKDADHRADIWAFGAVIYEMVTGARPFQGDTAASVMGAILKDAAPSVSSRQPIAPMSLDRLVRVCLAKDPDDRWQSLADVRRQLDWVLDSDPRDAPAGIMTPRRTGWALPMAALAALSSLALIGLWVSSRQGVGAGSDAAAVASTVFRIDPPAGMNLAGPMASTPVPQLAVSPDGRWVAFLVASASGQPTLWVRGLGDPELRAVAGTEGAADPFWSPDSRRVGFIANGALRTATLDAAAAPPKTIAKVAFDSRGATWRADNTIVFYNVDRGSLGVVSADGGAVRSLPLGSGIQTGRWPVFLPDGKHLLFFARYLDTERRGIYVQPFDAGPSPSASRVSNADWGAGFASGHLLFLSGSTLMAQPFDPLRLTSTGAAAPVVSGVGGSTTGYAAFSASTNGVLAYARDLALRSELRWVDRSGHIGEAIVPPADYVDLRISPDQNRVAFSRVEEDSRAPDVWILDIARGTTTRITNERASDGYSVWSPSGDRIVFRSNRNDGGGNELYVTPASPGAEARQVYGPSSPGYRSGTVFATSWLADGRLVFCQTVPENGFGIWITSLEENDARPLLDTAANELQAAISPDGRWMAYSSDQSGRYEIYVQDFPDGKGPRTLVSTAGGMQPQWRGDGSELFYLQPDGSLMQASVRSGPKFDTATPTSLFKTGTRLILNTFRMDYVPTQRGDRFLMKVPIKDGTAQSITVVLNWPSVLKK